MERTKPKLTNFYLFSFPSTLLLSPLPFLLSTSLSLITATLICPYTPGVIRKLGSSGILLPSIFSFLLLLFSFSPSSFSPPSFLVFVASTAIFDYILYVEAKIISVDDGRELEENERGELCLRCPNLMTGYLNKPDESILSPSFFCFLLFTFKCISLSMDDI